MNPPRCPPENDIDFLVASPGPVSCSEAARVQPHSPFAPAHDSYNRLLNRLEPDPEALWAEAEPRGAKARGAPIIDDSTLDKRRAKPIGLVTRHGSGPPKEVVRGINRSTRLGSDGDREIACDYRLSSTADGRTKHDHSFERPPMAKGRGSSPKYVPFDTWYARLENLEQVRDFGRLGLTRLRGDRKVSPADRRARARDDVPVSQGGTVLHRRGYGLVKVFRIDTPDGDMESGATNDLSMDEGVRRHDAEVRFAIESYHRELKRSWGVERCQVRARRAQRNHIGLALRAFLRLEWHFFTTGIGAFHAKLGLVRDAVRSYLDRPFITLPKPSTA